MSHTSPWASQPEAEAFDNHRGGDDADVTSQRRPWTVAPTAVHHFLRFARASRSYSPTAASIHSLLVTTVTQSYIQRDSRWLASFSDPTLFTLTNTPHDGQSNVGICLWKHHRVADPHRLPGLSVKCLNDNVHRTFGIPDPEPPSRVRLQTRREGQAALPISLPVTFSCDFYAEPETPYSQFSCVMRRRVSTTRKNAASPCAAQPHRHSLNVPLNPLRRRASECRRIQASVNHPGSSMSS